MKLFQDYKTELKDAYLPDIETVQYTGPKKKELPLVECIQIVQPLKILAKTAAALKIASDYDLGFNPEYSGYNTGLTREIGRGIQNATIAMYLLLFDKPPTDNSTVMTALVKAIRLTEETCQPYIIFTCDHQLYKIVLDIKWTYHEKFQIT